MHLFTIYISRVQQQLRHVMTWAAVEYKAAWAFVRSFSFAATVKLNCHLKALFPLDQVRSGGVSGPRGTIPYFGGTLASGPKLKNVEVPIAVC